MATPNYNHQSIVKPTPQVRPKRQPKKTVKRIPLARPKWNFLDLTMLAATILVAIVGVFMVINVSNQGAKANSHLTQVTAQLNQTKNDNNDLRQEIGTVTSNDKLSEVAKKENLTMNNDNVRNVK
ncbi:cell division protein FtsL [Weissella viridescens]|uniref:cell division protein FtsL n=1 Tax=Weissella viridescens TaxID=1629 RepID=UPI001D08F43D|nr:cell division protein FtsL [Weissella viridescens]MCB6840378.1 cell division protein FtsL [Weissella viridescens]MCB6847111.1 cell division protein FtsL [Weissella viridescens]WJI91671.1 cell division protein FtsL [Weissella viridescens]